MQEKRWRWFYWSYWHWGSVSMCWRVQNQLQRNIEETVRELYRVAGDIRMIARRVYEAEMRAYEIAARRTEK